MAEQTFLRNGRWITLTELLKLKKKTKATPAKENKKK